MSEYEYQKITLPVMTEEWKEDFKKHYRRRSDELEDWIGILIEFMLDRGFSDLEVMQALSSQVTRLFHVSGCRLEKEKWDSYSSWFLDIQTAFQEKQNEIIPQEKNYKNLVSSDVRIALRDEREIGLRDLVEEYKNDRDEEEPLFPERTE